MTGLNRRNLLASGAAALGGAGVGWGTRGLREPDGSGTSGTNGTAPTSTEPAADHVTGGDTIDFHGVHQAGIDTAAQAHLSLVGLDLLEGGGVEELGRMMRLLSDDASRFTSGRGALADTEPELAASPARLTVTFGFGPRVLRMLRPAYDPGLQELPEFPLDRLDPAWGQTDVVLQICTDDPVTLSHVRRMLLKDAAPFATTRWVQDGFRRARGTEAAGTTMRNLMGQVDGTVNLPASDHADLLWSTGRASGFDGGTFLVVRRIEMDLVDWDRTDRVAREFSVGRKLADGAPLTGSAEHDEPDFEAVDAVGFPVIDPASHVARMRSANTEERFLRRGYNYTTPDGGAGLLFLAFAADVERQFVPVQQRMDELDLLNEWVTTIGSAVYAVPPACVDGDFVGREMLGLPSPTTSGGDA
ncbi:Dyp-type peroxidase [Nocardioides zeae]|uniref:Dye decolorizing peroxidase n=1 Tax=Nocardioides zeae TaxID=1457234 RepID=A0AAJ1U9W6_9ACTN|nr:Dyp-type peroxidase [Nocardioides zeae]MDQ1106257.1 dye decolorizing peroxidase [Nocardioides zeae]